MLGVLNVESGWTLYHLSILYFFNFPAVVPAYGDGEKNDC